MIRALPSAAALVACALVACALVACALAGCGPLPPAPALWRIVVPIDPAAQRAATGRPYGDAFAQAEPRARAYILSKLPAPAGAFLDSLVEDGFACAGATCRYSAFRGARPCEGLIQVTVVVTLPRPDLPREAVLTEADVSVRAAAGPSGQSIEMRGCGWPG